MTSLIGGRRGRKDEQPELDSIYGDFHITAPNGYPSKNADLYVRELEPWQSVDEEFRLLRKESSDGANLAVKTPVDSQSADQIVTENDRNCRHTKSRALNVHASARHRSRSQSAHSTERRRDPEHRIRSSSSNRAGNPREQTRHRNQEVAQEEVMFNLSVLSGDRSPGEGIARPATVRTITPVLMHGRTTPSSTENVARVRSGSVGDQRAGTHHSFTNIGSLNSVLERSLGPTVTILSPVCESFGADEAHQSYHTAGRDANTALPPQSSFSKNDLTPSPGTLSDVGSAHHYHKASPPSAASHFNLINPLALNSTVSSKYHVNRHTTTECSQERIVPQLSPIDKPLPAFPAGTSRSPPLECTSFMRASSRTGPGLGATSIMRPSSRNNHVSNSGHAPTSPVRTHQRSASLGHVGTVELPPHEAASVSYSRKGSYPEESKPGGLTRSQPSSAGSGFSSDTQSSQSWSYSPPRVDSPESQPRSGTHPTPLTGPTCHRGSQDMSAHPAGQRSLATASPAPTMSGAGNVHVNGGNIYNELRDDLRVVARDLNAISLVDEREKKLSKLRIRARSASRHDRRSERPREREKENDFQHYAVHRGHGEQRVFTRDSVHVGAWGNTAFVPAYDMPNVRSAGRDFVDVKGQAEIVVPQKSQVEMVPDYDDLWC